MPLQVERVFNSIDLTRILFPVRVETVSPWAMAPRISTIEKVVMLSKDRVPEMSAYLYSGDLDPRAKRPLM